ncbi:cytochrome c oxidase assembly protein [Sediminicurvatus halobius]|uniref:Cytochrome c oxidase assembly protein n=1 Tax=Sediminicurvatus halobius TaxID=2182432 RepID=A0A2U2MYT9_9GAMM|nr:cytochrome c oxidase assembly protein [Spiribacter halobius]PWG61962.1 cytochrome c oxidase assembly protein [Spiribacter halobius]UEX78369.1 cytochrome c oxidase assembly protein [Spiribacter halobius]
MSDLLAWLRPWEPSLPILLACALAVGLYAAGLLRGARPGVPAMLAYFLGVGLMYAVTQTHVDYYSQYLFAAHRGQHLVLHHLAPFLIALSAPAPVLAAGLPAALRRLPHGRLAPLFRLLALCYRIVQQPVIAAVLFVGLIFFWLTPSIHFDAMLSLDLYWIMNWTMAVDGLLFWWLILERGRPGITPRLSPGRRILILALIMPPQIGLGAFITFSDRNLFEIYDVCGRAFPIGPLVDQQIGGLITWIPAAMMSVMAALVVLAFRLAPSERGAPATAAEAT